jgi:hypothetical protein
MTKTNSTTQRTIDSHSDYLRAIYRLHELELLTDLHGTLTGAERAEYHHLDMLTMSYEDRLAEAMDARSEYATEVR